MKAKKVVLISLFVSVALIVSLLEYYIPIPIPNVRLGLSNIIIINSILLFSFKEAFFISFLKAILLVIILGNPIIFIYNFYLIIYVTSNEISRIMDSIYCKNEIG